MLGVTQMDEKKVLKPIDEMLADPWQVDIQELFEASVNEPDEINKNLYDSLYTYKSLLRAFYFCFGINIYKQSQNR
ncbi:hypothetical protein ACA593_16285 [Lactiplantibacillus pentosus]|uniref:hypothetical protein n=1 Tax=Lactiplantibacillus pentosus TaxID=1589 RepID=UPI003C1DDD1C